MPIEPHEMAETSSQGKRLALVVGVNEALPMASYLAPLQHAERSANEIAEALQRFGDFKLFRPPLLGERVAARDVMDAIRQMVRQSVEQDLLVFYFAGHGYPLADDVDQQHVYLVTHDFDPRAVEELEDEGQYISLNWLNKLLCQRARAGKVLLILDCCYGGNMSKLPVDRPLDAAFEAFKQLFEVSRSSNQANGKTRATLAAAGQDREAWERDGSSVMTAHLVKILSGECPEAVDEAGNVTFERLQETLRKRMPPDHKPRISGGVEGDALILATHSSLSAEARRERERRTHHAEREQRLRAMFSDHSGFLQDRLESFVGREQELAEVRQRIDVLWPTGGYLTITGQAGQGKSSIIAKFVAEIAREQKGLEHVAYHFIPLTPPPDYQVALLRNLMARLILKYNLSDLFLASESRAALCEGFPRVLKEVAEKGGREIIFVDGLDRLQADQHIGLRDLSFLPQGPGSLPPGIVFVMGTRPDDTLRQLGRLKPYNEYQLPNLSRADFDQVLQHRGVTLDPALADRFYEALDKNALYLDLVAKELAARSDGPEQEVEEIIRQTADDPDNLFSLTVDRLRRHEHLWTTVIKPVLGLLLVTNEPLVREHLKNLLNLDSTTSIDGEQLDRGLERLGGLVVVDEQQRYSLFHLKFREHLRRDEQRHSKKRVFDAQDEQIWHKRFVAWCEQGGLVSIWKDVSSQKIEQERRLYARQHYISHIYHMGDWKKLWGVLDDGAYGKSKIQYGSSIRSYASDLDLGRETVAYAEWGVEEMLEQLPRLWRYTLLRCSLASRADNYPIEAFQLMLLLGKETKALGLAELMTSERSRLAVFFLIAKHFIEQHGREQEVKQLLLRIENMIRLIYSFNKEIDTPLDEGATDARFAETLLSLVWYLVKAGLWREAKRLLPEIKSTWAKAEGAWGAGSQYLYKGYGASPSLDSIPDEKRKSFVKALIYLVRLLEETGRTLEAEQLRTEAKHVIGAISNEIKRAEALINIARISREAEAKRFMSDAKNLLANSKDSEMQIDRTEALIYLAEFLRETGRAVEAEQLRKEAEHVISSISNGIRRAAVLISIARISGEAEAKRFVSDAKNLLTNDQRFVPGAESLLTNSEDDKTRIERAEVLIHLAEYLKETGHALEAEQLWSEAERVIVSIPYYSDEIKHFVLLINIAKFWEAAGYSSRSEKLWKVTEQQIDSVPYGKARAKALINVAELAIERGRLADAERFWSKVEKGFGLISNHQERNKALMNLAGIMGEAGYGVEARKIIGSINDQGRQAGALMSLAEVLGKAGYFSEAKQTIDSIDDQWRRAGALVNLAKALGEAGHLSEAEEIINALSEQSFQDKGWMNLSGRLANEASWEKAEQMIGTITDVWRRAESFANLVRELGEAGHLREAERIVSLISEAEPQTKARALMNLSSAFGKAHLWKDAERVVNLIADTGRRAEALVNLSALLAAAKQWASAEHIIGLISGSIFYSRIRAEALANLGKILASNGHRADAKRIWTETEQVIGSIYHSQKRADALTNLGRVLAEVGNLTDAERIWTEAEQVIHSITYPENQAEALINLGKAFRDTKHLADAKRIWSKAEKLIDTFLQPEIRVEALINLAKALGEVGVSPEVGRVWDKTRRIIGLLGDAGKRNKALANFPNLSNQNKINVDTVILIKKEALQIRDLKEASRLFDLFYGLISSYPDLGLALCQAFVWVDTFLCR